MARTYPEFGYNPVTGEWNDSLRGDYFWSNINVSEAVPDVMTPSTWSLWWIYHYEVSPFEFPGDHPMCGNICGRLYLNLGLLCSIYRALGRDVRREIQGDAECALAWQRLGAHFPNKLNTLHRQLDIIAAAAKNREAVRSEVTRLARLVRQFLIKAGKLTGLGDDIFFLSLDEMVSVLAGNRLPASTISAR